MKNKLKISLNDIILDYYRIKKGVPSYRLGQHFCNVTGLRDASFDGVDLYSCDNEEARIFSLKMICYYQWDMWDLPIFSEYDLSTIKPR